MYEEKAWKIIVKKTKIIQKKYNFGRERKGKGKQKRKAKRHSICIQKSSYQRVKKRLKKEAKTHMQERKKEKLSEHRKTGAFSRVCRRLPRRCHFCNANSSCKKYGQKIPKSHLCSKLCTLQC